MHIFTAYYWEKGYRTEKNQDSLAICQMVVRRKRCLMAVVCDGIGSLKDAEKASGYVTEQLVNWFYHAGPKVFGRKRGSRAIQNAVKREIYRVHQEFRKNSDEPLGCTLSLLLVINRRYFLWNAGDSRTYLGRRGTVKLLTKDDVWKGMLTKCIGNFPWRGVTVSKGWVRKKDTFLVCSDGFYRRLLQRELQAVLSGKQINTEKQAQNLLREAVSRLRSKDEKDDISAIYVKIRKPGYIENEKGRGGKRK